MSDVAISLCDAYTSTNSLCRLSKKSPWVEVNGAAALSSGQTQMGLNHAGGAPYEMMDPPDNLFPLRDPIAWVVGYPMPGTVPGAALPVAPAPIARERESPERGRVLKNGQILFSFE